jgi:hypothetical protein
MRLTKVGAILKEPKRLREWRPKTGKVSGRLLTCARPGWSPDGKQLDEIPDEVVDAWVNGLPRSLDLVIVSLLGHKPKPDGRSEFSYYSFRSCTETSAEDARKPTFQEWLDTKYGPGHYSVIEHPTTDTLGIPRDTLDAVKTKISTLLGADRTVVLMDSGGWSRVKQVCEKHMGFREITMNNANSLSAFPNRRPILVLPPASEGKGDKRGGPF